MSDRMMAKQTAYSILGGVLFGAGWWCLVDGFNMGMNGTPDGGISSAASGYAWLCPFGASLFYLMLNAMSWSELDERKVENPSTTTKAKAFLLCSLFISMAVIVGAAFIMVNKFLNVPGSYQWAGISTLVSTLLIVMAAFIQRFGTLPPTA